MKKNIESLNRQIDLIQAIYESKIEGIRHESFADKLEKEKEEFRTKLGDTHRIIKQIEEVVAKNPERRGRQINTANDQIKYLQSILDIKIDEKELDIPEEHIDEHIQGIERVISNEEVDMEDGCLFQN